MTPEQEQMLRETHDSVVQIQATCSGCQDKIVRHEVALNGTNGKGLKTRVAVLEKDRPNSVWMRAQLGAVILALLGFVALAGQRLLSQGTDTYEHPSQPRTTGN